MQPASVQDRKNLCNLLSYAEEILRATERVVSDLAKDALMAFYEHDVSSLDGVTAPGEDNSWLRVARLHETAPPEPIEAYRPWITRQAGAGALTRPQLAETHLVAVSIEEASDLIEAGLALVDDVMKPRGDRKDCFETVDILLRLANMPEFAATFEEWVNGCWTAWAEKEKPRRRSISFYNRLFEVQQRSASMGDDVSIEAVFGVGLARWNHPIGKVNAPLIEAAVELELDPEDGALIVRPRVQPPRLVLNPFDTLEIDGVGKLQREASAHLDRLYGDPDVGFSPHELSAFETVLRMCHARLAPDAVYERDIRGDDDDRTPPRADDKLRISDTWVLYVRQRSVNVRCDDIRRLAVRVREIEDDAGLPAPALQMTTRPTGARLDDDAVDLGNTILDMPENSHGSGRPSIAEGGAAPSDQRKAYFFPLPYNDDQIEIVRRLEQNSISGVVVQGPPGTGKTHTIANIIAHYMATGRRVLVSAHEPEALSAIQHKLPESIRDLAISVIHSDREGSRRLEQAVDILATQVKQIDKRAYNERRIELERALAETRTELTDIDKHLHDYARLNLTSTEYRGERLMPMDLAARVEVERPLHAWFQDEIDTAPGFEPRFGDADIGDARRIRRELGRDIVYAGEELPDITTLPNVPQVLAAHNALVRDWKTNARSTSGDLPYVSFGPRAGLEEARKLLGWLEALETWAGAVSLTDSWLTELYRILVGVKPVHETVRDGMLTLSREWKELSAEGRSFALRGVELADVPISDAAFDGAVEALAEGRKAFGLFSFSKSALRTKIEAVRVEGAQPSGATGWSCVQSYRTWQRRAAAFFGRWSAAAKSIGFPALAGDWNILSLEFVHLGGFVEQMCEFHNESSRYVELVAAIFPHGVDARRVVFHCEVASVREALVASLDKEDHAEAYELRRRLEQSGGAGKPLHAALQAIGQALGDPEVAPRELAEEWQSVLDEARRLDGLREPRRRLDAISFAVRASGAPKWAAALLNYPAEDLDPWTPKGWRDSWDWARAEGHIRGLSNRSALAALSARRTALEEKQRDLLSEIVRLRTFIGLKQGITERVASALTKFAIKVRQLGAGTGKSAERHRRAIREATLEAAEAVPCWILPEWRVAEQLPSELATFDLVIIDEASQSNVTALSAVMRGKKLLVVGDDKQVSPSAVGMEEKKIVQLRETFLRGMDIANYLEPTTSLYDLAAMTFPGSVIMLREHFRCVEPIISFSSRFYPKALIPLRVPTAEERLDPPLVDVFVRRGRKERDVNKREAAFIVEEIARLVGASEYAKRTFGVISLIGDKQAKLIQEKLIDVVGTEAIAKHRIMCGGASTFQGQERDIMFLSMVACPSTARAQTARLMEQRFNVAMSRARDRMYLVRSVAESSLSPKDLKAAVIEHFRNPMAGSILAQPKDVLEACDSGFEREVGGRLLDLGYRVRPQVQVGAYRIDFVVEGEGSRRLAVELDGDQYHGPDKWAEDQYRQRALERLGWIFWRCWGSHWLSDRESCFDDLLATLERLQIEPVGGEFSPQVWTEHRVVDGEPASEVSVPETEAPAGIGTPAETGGERDGAVVLEAGDTVIVRFADDNRVRSFRLSREANDPDRGIVHIGQPIGAALLGNGLEEEVDLVVGGRTRRVLIEKITKAA